jgi:hypothetical protein
MNPLFFALLACQDKPDPTTDDTLPHGEDETVTVFAEEYVHFGEENRRQVDVPVTFPDDTASYSQITGRFSLDCPDSRCDWWDRYATFGIVQDAGTEAESYIELDRFITPYRVGFSWESDLTDLRPLLTGEQTMRVFIDTWVTDGHENGNGWLFTAELDFAGGAPPSPAATANIPVWGHLSWLAGLPDNPVEAQVVPQDIDLPDHSSATLRSFISGHGWNNNQNCAEFCAKDHLFAVNGEEEGREVWREDCAETVTDGLQRGTWEYSRAGWCPGAQVYPWDIDISDETTDTSSASVGYRLEDFEWRGDGDQPYYYLSAMIITYE